MDRVLLVACDAKIEERLKQKLESEGSTVASVLGLHDLPQALAAFSPTLVLVDDRKIGAFQVRQAVESEGFGALRVVTLSEKKDEYGSVLGIGCLDAIVDWAMEGCLYILGCLGLIAVSIIAGLIFRGCG